MHDDDLTDVGSAASPLSEDLDTMHKRPLPDSDPSATSPPPCKRSRSAISDPHSPSASPSVEFVEACTSNSGPAPEFVARLNISAQDERRKQLLLRLRDIDAKKAALARQPSPPCDGQDSDVVIVEQKSTPAKSRPTRGRKSRLPARNKSTRGRKPASPIVIDVDAQPSLLPQKPRGKAPARAKKSPAGKSVPSAPTRTSSRVRRPRTPNADASLPTSELRRPTPTCMSKCKRFQFCKKLITSLLRNARTGPFSAPVLELWPKEAIPRYFDVISHPMDLRTVKRNLETSVYISPCHDGVIAYQFEAAMFMDDVRLVFRNCMVYNRAGDMLFNAARDLLEDFEKTMDEQLPPKLSIKEAARTFAKKRSIGGRARKARVVAVGEKDEEPGLSDSPTVTNLASATAKSSMKKDSWSASVSRSDESEPSDVPPGTVEEMKERLTYLRDCRTAVLARTPVPKGSGYLTRAALLYGVAISHSQKQRCVSAIESRVPIGKMEALLDMVKSAGGGYMDPDDEQFVFEFDNLDNQAWRNVEAFLEQYVPGFKTIRHSTLGREFAAVESVDEEIESLQESLKQATAEQPKRPQQAVVDKPRSFFGGDESSSDESDDDSDSSDESDSDSDAE